MPPQINRGQLLMFIIFLTFLLPSAPPEEAGYLPSEERKRIVKEHRDEITQSREELANNDYASGYGNLTGFKLSYLDAKQGRNVSDWPFEDKIGTPFVEDESQSILPNAVSKRAKEIWNSEEKVVKKRSDEQDVIMWDKTLKNGSPWFNITGTIRGNFERYEAEPLTPIPMPFPSYYQNLSLFNEVDRQVDQDPTTDSSSFESAIEPYAVPADKVGNVTDSTGIAKISLKNYNLTENSADSTFVVVNLKLNDMEEKKDHNLQLSGVYHQDSGNLVAVTRSAKFAGLYALPHLNLADGALFNQTRELFKFVTNQTKLEDLGLNRLEELLDLGARCEYIAYMHFESTGLSPEELKDIDSELERPLGRPLSTIPPVTLSSGLLYSPDCGVMLDLKTAVGPREEIHDKDLKKTLLLCVALISGQIWLFLKQMGSTNTPSTMSRISFWSIAIINIVDGSLSMIALLCSLIFGSLYIQFAVCAFLAFTCSSIFEIRYMILIYATQINERAINWRTALQGTPIDERQNANDDNNDNNANANETGAPLPAPATQQQQVVTEQDEQTISGKLYMRFFFSLTVFSFLVLNVSLWPKKQRVGFEYILGTVINSYWVPQIYRNVIRGSRMSFRWDFILGTSIIRFIPIVYLNAFKNPFYHHKDHHIIIALFIWLSFQILLLWLQTLLGPRFFLPEKYLPKTYDYHPILTFEDLENSFNVDHEVVDSTQTHSKCKIDCTICMNSFEVPVMNQKQDDAEGGGGAGVGVSRAVHLMSRRAYMVTPCRHIFHTECLENWMKYKLQCPVCRNSLPPL